MIRRGRKFINLHGVHHCEYKGAAQVLEPLAKGVDDEEADFPLREMMVCSKFKK